MGAACSTEDAGADTAATAHSEAQPWPNLGQLNDAPTPFVTALGRPSRSHVATLALATTLCSLSAQKTELGMLRLSVMKKRAVALGVSSEQLEAVDDSQNPKEALIELLLELQKGRPSDAENSTSVRRREELTRLKASEVRRCAVSAGATSVDLDAADDSPDAKAFLIDLTISLEMSAERADTVEAFAATLCSVADGEVAAKRLVVALEHGAELVEDALGSASRRTRRELQQLLDRAEDEAELIANHGCAQLQKCTVGALEELAGSVLAVEALVAGTRDGSSADAVGVLARLVANIDSCRDLVVQAVAVLAAVADEGEKRDDGAGLSFALTFLGGLERAAEVAALESECAAIPLLVDMVWDSTRNVAEREEACKALYTLTIRVGAPLVNNESAVLYVTTCTRQLFSMFIDGQETLTIFAGAVNWSLCFDLVSKVTRPHSLQGVLLKHSKVMFQQMKNLSAANVERIVDLTLEIASCDDDDLATFGAFMLGIAVQIHASSYMAGCQRGWFTASVEFYRSRVGSHPPAQWWIDHASLTTEQTNAVLGAYCVWQGLPKTGLKLTQVPAIDPDWQYAVEESIHVLRVVHEAELSKRQTMFFYPAYFSLSILEYAVNTTRQKHVLLQKRIPEACMYMIANDFFQDSAAHNLGTRAAGIAVSLIGSNESGLVLTREAVQNVVDSFSSCFDPETHYVTYVAANVVTYARRVANALVADTNKPFVIEAAGALDALVEGLLLDSSNPRRDQERAGDLQLVCAEALQQLALSAVGEAALKANSRAMSALQEMKTAGLTPAARQCAVGALFKLEGSKKPTIPALASGANTAGMDSGKHLMVSYNWDHQAVVLRVVAALKGRGYSLWVDVESMSGSTVDSMALAVEGASVMLICVSRSYKMSSNCRLEANYGLQREIAMVPLMMEEGYVPDGWLGLLLGTRMWYPMYGEAVARADVFEERMVALSRDLGDRGKVQTDGATSLAGDNEMVAGLDAATLSAQKAELGMLRLSVMKKRAVALGVSSEQLEAVDDSQN
eukprot:SAG31_NODE_3930_length_3742_cov_2.584408_2_plen_1021_part_01